MIRHECHNRLSRRANDRRFIPWLIRFTQKPAVLLFAQGIAFVAGCMLIGLIVFALGKGIL